MAYKICILGNTKQHAEFWLGQLADYNREQVLVKLREVVILKDCTILHAYGMRDLRDRYPIISEVFLAPGIGGEDAQQIYDHLERLMQRSEIPPEFRWHYMGCSMSMG